MSVEQATYKVLDTDGSCELRLYEPLVLAVSRESDLRGYSGFNAVFNYISGDNRGARRISMTAPVINNLDDQPLKTAFVMPKQFRSARDLPEPNDPDLRLVEVPERLVAAITFSGNIRRELLADKKAELLAFVRSQRLTAIGGIELARYNPPFIPGFIKHNELLLAVEPLPQERRAAE